MYQKPLNLISLLAIVMMAIAPSSAFADGTAATTYVLQQGSEGAPPHDVPDGTTPGGLMVTLINAVCDANDAMDCEFVQGSYNDCLTTDPSFPYSQVIGPALLDRDIIGCLTWGESAARTLAGVSSTLPLVDSGPPGAQDSSIWGLGVVPNTATSLHFNDGWAADPICSGGEGYTYINTTASGPTSQDVADAAAVGGDDFVVKANYIPASIPAGYTQVAAIDCVGGSGMITYPPANLQDTVSFHANFACGRSLIAENGTYDAICQEAAGVGVDYMQNTPYCLNPNDILAPTAQCLAKQQNQQ